MYIYIYSKVNEIWEELGGRVKRKMKRVEEEEEWKANETKLDGLWTDEKRIYKRRERGKREGEEGEGEEDGREGGREGGERKREGAAKLAV